MEANFKENVDYVTTLDQEKAAIGMRLGELETEIAFYKQELTLKQKEIVK